MKNIVIFGRNFTALRYSLSIDNVSFFVYNIYAEKLIITWARKGFDGDFEV